MIKELLGIPRRVLLLFVKIVIAVFRTIFKVFKGGVEVKQSADTMKSAEQSSMLYFWGDHFMLVKAKFTKDLNYVSPHNANRLFRVSKIYKNFNTPERIVVVDNDNPETLDFEKPPKLDEFERLIVNELDIKDGKDIKTTTSMEKFKIFGGRELNSIAYDIYRHNILQFLSNPEKSELIYIILAVFFLASFLGFIGGGLFTAMIGYLL